MAIEFPKSQLLILKICGVIIAIGLVILGIDKFIVQPTEPTDEELLANAAAELEMTLHESYSDAETLIAFTEDLNGIVEPAEEIGAALTRKAPDHELIVYEHRFDARALRTTTQSHSMGVELLGILIRLPGAELPLFGVRSDGRMAAPDEAAARAVLGGGAAERMKSFRGFVMAAKGERVLFLSEPPRSALVAATQRSSGPEFLPGLRNSGLKIDVQRAIDITNLLALPPDQESPAIADVYKIDTSDIEVNVEVPELDLGLQETVSETRREIDEIMAKAEAERQALREKREAESAARRADFEAKMEARRKKAQEDLERIRNGGGAGDASESEVTDGAETPDGDGR